MRTTSPLAIQPPPGPTLDPDEKPGRVLVVDDEPALLRAYARTLEAAGHEVVTAAEGQSALAAFRHASFDLVISDITMPGMSGRGSSGQPSGEARAASVLGEAIDATGRPLARARVELLHALAGRPVGAPMVATATDTDGRWSFDAVEAGEYVVRLLVNGQRTGVPVVVESGDRLDGVRIVAPTAAASRLELRQEGEAAAAAGTGTSGVLTTTTLLMIAAGAGAGLGATLALVNDGS